jgi:hypothetical protein
MSDPSIGQTAKHAVVFLRQFHKDLHAVVRSLDEALYRDRWEATLGAKISSDLGNRLDSSKWLLESVTRIYAPKGQGKRTRQIIATTIALAPDAMDEAALLCVAATFADPMEPLHDIWNLWMSSESVIAFLSARSGPHDIGRGLLDAGFMPRASSARAFLVPLCTLVDTESLQNRVITPALEASASLRPEE